MLKRRNIISALFLTIAVVGTGYFYLERRQNLDWTIPVIQMDSEEIQVSVQEPIDSLFQGMKASDAKDGDVSESLVIESISEFIEPNSRIVNYAAFDSDNHVAKKSRMITYSDYVSPHFILNEPLKVPASNQNTDILGLVGATDCLDGDISNQIIFSEDSNINLSIPSDYKATFLVSNSAGDTQELPVTVSVYDSAQERYLPQIHLSTYLVYLKAGEKLKLRSLIQGCTYEGVDYTVVENNGILGHTREEINQFSANGTLDYYNMTGVDRSRFAIKGKVDNTVPGTYEIQYSLDDGRGYIGSVLLYVIVEE